VFSLNATGTGIALSSDAGLQYNPSTNVLTADVFSGNHTGTAFTATNFFGTLTGNVTGNVTGTATTASNINTTSATTAATHYVLFSPVNATASGVAVSSDAQLQFNPATNVLTADVFSGNHTGTAFTATNFFGTLVGNSSTATTASNLNVVSATTNSAHYITFSPASSGSGLATSADTDLAYNPSTNVLSATVFSGNFTGTAATATNFFGTLVGNSSTATTAQNINLAAGGNASNHSIVFSLNATGSGVALSSDAELQYNPSTNALSVGTGSFTANSVRIGNSANTVDTSSGNLTLDSTGGQVNINDNVVIQGNLTVQGTTLTVDSTITTIVDPVIVLGSGVGGTHSTADNNQDRGIEFRYSNGGTAVTGYFGFKDTDFKFRYIPNATLSGTNVYSGNVGVIVANLEGNVSATAVTATNFYGTLVGNTATATTSQNINTTTAATASAHYILFSPVNATTSGVAVSSDSTLQFNPGTNVLTTDVFSGNLSATAATATNFFGTHVGAVTGNVTGTATTAQNLNTTAATTAGAHYLLFSPVNATASGVAVSSDSTLQFNPGTNVLTTDVFSGNLSGTAATATNFFGTFNGSLVGTATTAQNVNVNATTINASHFITFSPASSGSGLATSTDTDLTYNPGSNVLSAGVFSGNVTGTAVTATNFFGTLTGNVTGNLTGTATTSQNVNTVSATTSANHFITFSPVNGASGIALSSDAQLTYNPATDVLSASVFSGNHTGTAFTATNFFGTLTGNVTGNVTGTATTATNINTSTATTAGAHYLLFSPVNATASGVAVSSDSVLQFNPGTNVLTTDIFSGNLSATAATATNFFGTLVGNSSTATTASNVNVNTTTINATHYITFSPALSGSGLATSTDTDLSYNPGTNVLTAGVFSGNVTGTAITATNFFGTLIGSVGTATTAQNVNTVSATTSSSHFLLFSPVNGASGVAVSSDAQLTYNPSTDVLTASVFSGNHTGTAFTATNFFGALTGNVTGTATTSQNVNTVSASTSANHFVTFSPVNGASGVALSSDAQLTYNPATDVLTASVFSGNHTGTAFTATNFFGTLTGNVTGNLTGTATTSQNVNLAAGGNNSNHSVVFSLNASGTGVGLSSDAGLQYNPSTNVLTADVFSGNHTGTAFTATNFFGTLVGNSSTATTASNVNVNTTTINATHFITFAPASSGSGLANSTDTDLTYNPGTNVLTAGVFSGNVTGTATTSQNVNTVVATTNVSHFITFSPVNGASGVAISSDADLTYNPSTNVLTAGVFSGNHTGTAFTATNFFGTLTGNVTGTVTGNLTGTATTATNINTTTATTSATHYLLFSPVNATASGVAVSSDAQLTYNPATDVLTASVFSGNHTGTAFTATNFFGTLTGNVTGNLTGTATTAQNVNLAGGGNNSNHSVVFSLNATGTGVGLSSDAGIQYNPATHVLTADVFSGNHTGTAFTATNFFGTLTGNVTGNVTGTATTSQNINTTAATSAGAHFILFSPVNATASGVAVSSDAQLQFNPATNVLTADVFSGNHTGTAFTATNFFGALTGNVTGTATTSQNVNTVSATTAANHFITFSPVNGASGVALSSDAQLTYNPATDVLSATTFSGNVSGTAITATNFFGTLVGSVGTATTSQNVNTVSATTSASHFLLFSPVNGASGVAVSSDAQLTYNPSTDVLTASVFSGNHTGTAFTATNFFGTLTGNVTGTATTSQNVNLAAGANNSNHSVIFSLNATGTGVGLSSDAGLQYNPATNVLTADVFSGNHTGTAITATNFFGTLTGNVTGTATTAQNINLAAGANNSNHSVVFSLNASGTGVGLSSDAGLQYNPSTNVLTADVFNGNFTGTAATATNFFGTLVGNSSTATTSRNVNTVTATTSGVHYITFSPVNGASGVALSSDTQLTYNPATDVLSATTFSGNVTGTAITATNFYGTLIGSVGSATTSQNINTTAATTAGVHYLLFSPVNATTSGVAVSSDAQLQFNPGTNVLTADVFSGNLSATAATATNFYGTHIGAVTGNLTGTATTAQNINLAAGANNSNHSVVFSLNATGTGVGLSSDAGLQYNPSTNVLTADVFTGNLSGTAATATNFYGTHIGAVTGNVTGNLIGTATTSQNVNTVSANTSVVHYITFSPTNGASGVALSSDTQLTYNPATDVLSATTFSGNVTGTAITATNFYGTLIGSVGTATTAQNVNLAAGANNSNHSVIFSLNASGTGIGLSSDAGLQYNPSTNVLTADVFSGNHTGTAFTATNFFGALTGNVTGTSTTSQNLNTVAATTAGTHYLLFSPVNATASGVAVSSDSTLQFNPGTNVLTTDVFSGNLSATAATATNFYGTHIGGVTGNVTGTATTSQNVNTVSATTSGVHYLTFSPINGASGVALSSDAQLTYNPGTDVLTATTFSGNVTGTAVTATNFFGTLTGNVTGTATTSQNVNLAAGANNSNHSVIFSLNATGTGIGLSSDAGLQYNPSTNVLTADVFSGNHTGTAFTATNFFGAVTGNVTGTATTSQNVNTVTANTSTNHFITFSPVNGASGVALSSDAQLTYNPATDVLSATTFSGNVSGTAITASNFYGTLIGSVGSATTSQNINTTAATTAGAHYLLFSPVNATTSGVAVSSDAQLQFNPGTNVLTADVFSGNLSGTASTVVLERVTSIVNTTSSTTGALVVSGGVGICGSMFIDGTVKLNYTSGNALNVADRVVVGTTNNFEGLNVNSNYSFAFNVQDKANNNRFTIDVSNNKTYLSGSSASHELRLYNANQSTYTGFAASNSGTVTYILPAGDGSSGQVLATNGSSRLYWSTPSAGSGGGSSGVNPGAQYQIAFYSATGSSVDGSTTFTNNTATSTVSITHATSSTATNVGALVVTGGLGLGGNAFIGGTVTVTNSTASTTTANGALVVTGGLGVGGQINSASIVTSGNAVFSGNLTFNGNGTFGNLATADTIAFNARSTTDFNPSASNSVDLGLNSLVWRNLFANFITGSAVTATNFYGTLAGNVTGTATTAQNINTTSATTSGAHYLLFSPVNATASGVAVSSDAQLQFNPGTNVLTADVFSGNLSGTAATATNFYGTHIGNVTGTATTAQNVNTVSANTNASHFLTFSPVNGGSGVALSTDTNLTFNSLSNVLTSGVFSGNLSATAATSGLFAVGNLTYAAPNLLAAFQSSVNSYNQVIIQNSNNGASASADLVLNNDTSTDIGRYGNFGMNSSGFTGLGSTGIPNAVFLTSTTSELVLGTTTNNRIRFVNENVDTFQITGTGSSVYTTTATLSKNSGAFVVAGGAAIGLSLSVGQGIQLYNSTNGNHTGFKAGATSANSVYTLPLAYPSTGSSILQSDTSGTMIWVNAPTGGSATPAGNNTELQYNNGGAFGGATGLTWQSVNNTLQINSNASHTTSAQVGLRLENGLASGGQATRWSPTFEMAGRSGIANVYFSRFATEVVPSGPATYASALRFRYSQDQGTASFGSNLFSIHSTLGIGIGGSTVSSNFMSYIRAHESQAADIFYKLPLAAPGTGASFLQCDTSGNMSWVNSPGGGSGSPAGSPKQIQFNNNGAFGGAGGFEYISVGGTAVTVSMFSLAGGGYTSGLWVNVLSASSTKVGIGLSNPQFELEINGELSATNKSFVINHPTKPGMKLRYGSLEGPENGVYVRGELKGTNIIEVPDHWIGLVHEDSYTVHLTPIGRYSQLYVEKIENYNVHIADNSMDPIHCYYSVWAERKDIPKLVTEY
jgi:hypothetical protein